MIIADTNIESTQLKQGHEPAPRSLDIIATELRAARNEVIRATSARHEGELALFEAERLAQNRYRELTHELRLAAMGLTPAQEAEEWAKGRAL